jgi:biopolymer transport protein ExbB
MTKNGNHASHPIRRVLLAAALIGSGPLIAYAQTPDVEADERARGALESAGTEDVPASTGTPLPDEEFDTAAASINMLDLLVSGGWLMVPIGLFSIVVIAIGIERAIALRRGRVLPDELVATLGRYSHNDGSFEPQKVYRLCQEFPSSAANVIRAMLLKLGRPHQEVEEAVHEAAQREAGRLYSNVRTLNLAASVTPLLGLLGTVWGMILSFYVTANMPVGANRAEVLAEGIYIALVTTFGGLVVAIPAAILAHYFEGRIESLLRRVEELISSLLPQVERYEGSARFRSGGSAVPTEDPTHGRTT